MTGSWGRGSGKRQVGWKKVLNTLLREDHCGNGERQQVSVEGRREALYGPETACGETRRR